MSDLAPPRLFVILCGSGLFFHCSDGDMDFLIEICPLISRSSSLDPNCSSKDSVDILRWMCDASGAEAEL